MTSSICKSCGTCSDCIPREEDHRGSRMPEHMPTVDPEFIAALDRVPEEVGKEKEETNCR